MALAAERYRVTPSAVTRHAALGGNIGVWMIRIIQSTRKPAGLAGL
jgi:hypothetical protein